MIDWVWEIRNEQCDAKIPSESLEIYLAWLSKSNKIKPPYCPRTSGIHCCRRSNGIAGLRGVKQVPTNITCHFRNASCAVDGTWEPFWRPVHSFVGCLVFRGVTVRDDHIRQLPLPGAEQQSGPGARQVRQHPRGACRNQIAAVSCDVQTFLDQRGLIHWRDTLFTERLCSAHAGTWLPPSDQRLRK